MQVSGLNSKLALEKPATLRLIVIYRWLAMLPPTLGLFWLDLPFDHTLAIVFYGLAWVNLILQTALYAWVKSNERKVPNSLVSGKAFILVLTVFEWLVGALLNSGGGVLHSPYYLYSLAGIFQAALFLGLVGIGLSAGTLGASYLAAFVTELVLGEKNNNWLMPVMGLGGFFLCALGLSYLLVTARQLRHQTSLVERYQSVFEQQNQALELAHRRLDYLAHFSRVLQEGNTIMKVEQLALQYIGRFLEATRERNGVPSPNEPGQRVQLLKSAEAQEWLQDGFSTMTEQTVLERPGREVVTVWRNRQRYWVMPLIYKGEQLGALAVPKNSVSSETEGEEKLLLALLADQMARVLGSLKQNQALAVEAERVRLAMDMHDVVAQSLFGIGLNLNACLKLIDKEPQVVRQRLSDLQTLAFDTLGSVRSIIYDLWNEETGKTDFASLVRSYITKAGKLYPFEIKVEIHDPTRLGFELEQERQKMLYRILQEALSNASKHSGAGQVQVILARNGAQLALEVRDNGHGFDVAQKAGRGKLLVEGQTVSGGMGLSNMQERLEQLDGELVIESKPGRGTRLVATIPLAVPPPSSTNLVQAASK